MKSKKLLIFDGLLIVFCLWFDQFVKALTVSHLKGNPPYVLWDGVFELQYLENRGSAFGMFMNQKIFLLCVGFVFMSVLLYGLIKVPATKKYFWVHFAISFLIAGGIGNMIDRFRYDYVVDLFSFVLIHFPIFNVADIYICVATGILLLLFLFIYKEEDLAFLKKSKKEK